MKKTILSVMAITSMVMVVGCKLNKENEASSSNDIIFSTVSAELKTKSATSTDVFVSGDRVGIYVVTRTVSNATPQSPMTPAHAENVIGVSDGSNGLGLNPSIKYPAGNNVDVYSYYPYSATPNNGTNGEIREVNINQDQQTESAYKLSDFKVARYINWTKPATPAPVPLDFKHQMVKIDIELKNGSGIFSLEPLKAAVVKFKDVPVTAQYDFLLNTFEVNKNGNKGTILPFGVFEIGTGAKNDRLVGKSLIIMPRMTTDPDYNFEIDFDGKQFLLPINAKMEAGKSYNYLVTVNREGITIKTSITPWVDGGEITGTTTF